MSGFVRDGLYIGHYKAISLIVRYEGFEMWTIVGATSELDTRSFQEIGPRIDEATDNPKPPALLSRSASTDN